MFEFSTPESLLEIDFAAAAVRPGGPHRHGRRTCASAWWTAVEICYREAGEVLFEQAARRAAAPPALQRAVRLQALRHRVRRRPSRSLFSFNSPSGACPRCQGFGNTIDYDLDRVIPDRSLSLEEGAVEPWTKPQHRWAWLELKRTAAAACA